MTAWVLIVWMGTSYSFTISNIESERECKRLWEEMKTAGPSSFPEGRCFSYRAAYRF